MKQVGIPEYLKNYAHDLTQKRVEVNKERYQGTPKQRRGTLDSALFGGEVDREYYTDYIGILAELLTRHYYEITPQYSSYSVSTFIKKHSTAVADPDLIVTKQGEELKISIKACEKSLKANKHTMDKETSDVVVFILFQSPTEYIVAHFTPSEVRQWPIKFGYTAYYNLTLKQLRDGYHPNAGRHQSHNESDARPTDSKE